MAISFTVYCRPEPQGSIRAFTPKGWTRPILTSDNKDLKSFRQELAGAALRARAKAGFSDLVFPRHRAVTLIVKFFFQRPESIPKKRIEHVVRPDCSKLIRAAEDSLSGIIYNDDAQIVSIHASKHYGAPERVELQIENFEKEQVANEEIEGRTSKPTWDGRPGNPGA